MSNRISNYLKYRGKCKILAEQLSKEKGYELVRGYYNEPIWNTKEQHWWCVDDKGIIHDPSRKQFPSGGIAEFYERFNGYIDCKECGKSIHEDERIMIGRYAVCSDKCAGLLVGLKIK